MDVLVETNGDKESSTKRKRFICSIEGCFKEFTKNRKLQNHLRLHNGERPFVCDIKNCCKIYTNSSHLQRHKKTKHTDNSERIMCSADGCGRELANKTSLKKHIHRWHNPSRVYPFMCLVCPQGFYKKRQLQQHSYLHTGELPFSCDQCTAKFSTIKQKNCHRSAHKNYTCECGETCEKWTGLRAHSKICTLRSFKCSVCNKRFSNKENLRIHIKVHMDKEDKDVYICPYDDCKRYYFYTVNLTEHINNIHKKIPKPKIPCTYEGCNKLLSRMQSYKNHLKTHEVNHKPKFPRKPRKDKGIPKKKTIEELCSINFVHSTEIKNKKKTDHEECECENVAFKNIIPGNENT